MRQHRSVSVLAPALVFTGYRINRSHGIYLHGKFVTLPRSGLCLLIQMVLARANSVTGYLRADPVAMWRLRLALANAVGPDRVKALIETGGRAEYRVTIPCAAFKTQIGVMRCFRELVDLEMISKKDLARLRRRCRAMKSV